MPETLSANRWPHLLLFLGLLFLGLTGWSVYRSISGVSAVTDRQYYAHGLRYNASLVEQKAAESLGWQVSVSLQNGYLASEWTGINGQPVSGGEARLVIPVKNRGAITLPLAEGSTGRYGITLPGELQGEIPALLTFSHGGATFRRALLLNL
ncbi:MAG TPA: FixH family protein [Desulfuromonadales bacterium]|jgi:nitrogen fixation protein FixH